MAASPSPTDKFFGFLDTLDELKRHEIETYCRPMEFKPGEYVCREGSDADSAFILHRGVVEVVTESHDGTQPRSVTHLLPGDIFGEISVLTGYPRIATVRAVEESEIWILAKADFQRLMHRVPAFGEMIAIQLARRLHRATAEQSHRSNYIDLAGNLFRFDILLVFQIILSSGQRGELQLTSPSNDLLGGFYFETGAVRFARFAHLEGVEAVGQAFLQPATEGSFAFQIIEGPTLEFQIDKRIDEDGMSVLMEATAGRDHFQALPEALRKMECTLARTGAPVPESLEPLAERIMRLIEKRPQHLQSVWRRLDVSCGTLANAVRELERNQLLTVETTAREKEPAPE